MKTIIKGAWLMAPEGLKKDFGLEMTDGTITKVAPNAELKAEGADEVLDLKDQIILPGFVNGHNHMYGFLSHGITAEAIVTDFSSFLDDFWWPYVEDRLDHELVEATTEMACVEMIDSGVTAFVDILEGPHSIPGALEVEAKVVEKAGLRGKLSFEADKLVANVKAVVEAIQAARPNTVKGVFIKSLTLASTMGVGVPCELAADAE